MNTSRPVWRAALVGVALSVVLLLLLAPPTGWLARQQFATVGFHIPQGDAQRQATEAARRARAAHQFPNDLDVQITAALDSADVQVAAYQALEDAKAQSAALHGHSYAYTLDAVPFRIAALRTLVPRFGINPALYATMLRFQSLRWHLARPEQDLITNLHPSPTQPTYARPTPAALSAWDADCAVGERLDPANAFFPMMRAAGLYAAHRDEAGINAVLRAGQKPLWNDYTDSEMNGNQRLADAADGVPGVLNHEKIFAGTLLPHLASLRTIARLATVEAMQKEQAGDVADGLALRRSLMSVGDRMRVQSPIFVGNLVGMAIAAIAESRPGGAAPQAGSAPTKLSDAQKLHWYNARRAEQFAAYAVQHGHPELADLARMQAASDEAGHAIWDRAEPKAVFNRLLPNATLWIAGEAILASVSWLLMLGLAAHLLSRRTAFQASHPLPRSVKWGIAMIFIMVFIVLCSQSTGVTDLQFAIVSSATIIAAIGLSALFLLRRRITRPALARFTRAFFVTALVLAGAAGIISWQAQGIGEMWQSLSENGGATALAGEVTFAFPVLLLLVFAIWGRVRRVPVNVALVRGFLASSVPLACILLLVWGGLCLHTLRQERALNAELDRMTAHEGRYYAALAGAVWPGPVVP